MYRAICFIILIGSIFNGIVASAQIHISDHTYSTDDSMYENMQYIIPQKDIEFSQILNTHFTSFSDNKIPNLGLQKHSVWIKFKIKYQASPTGPTGFTLEVANPLLTTADLYIVDSGGRVDSILQGNRFPFSKRIIRTSDFVYRLVLNNNETYTCYLRIAGNYPLILPISINSLKAQFNKSAAENAISVSFAGILIVMILYNGFIAFSTKDNSYWYYIVFLLFLGLSQLSLNGFNYMFLWPKWPKFNNNSLILFSNLAGVSVILFSYSFLHLRKYGNKLIHTLFGLIILGLVDSIVMIFTNALGLAFYIMQLSTFFGGGILLVVAFWVLKRNKNARFFIFAWITLLLCSTVFILKDYNLFPYNLLTSHIVQLGSVIEVVVLSIGLADRINRLREQRDMARTAELSAVKETEKIVRNQNIILNQKVEERTLALSEANSKLNQSLTDLQQAQTQLVESEKMTSLGQLTAGIAHEINNPINFVSSSISPLNRDIEQLFQVIEHIESIGLEKGKKSLIKLQEMAAYKKEQDLDYLKVEINHLLKGVHDGASRTADIVKGLRIFSHMDSNSFSPANINVALQSTISVASSVLKTIEIETHYEESLPLVTCFPGKLNQVFLNIITNAAFAIGEKFEKNPGGKIVVSTQSQNENVIVSIKDNGKGMTEETKKKVFEPFFTTKPVGQGVGLGMSISFSILKQHAAKCTILSKPGVGTEFIIQLPVKPPANEENETLNNLENQKENIVSLK